MFIEKTMAIECPHCLNRQGFAFNTCIECGWNHVANEFRFIEVRLEDLPDLDPYLVAKHSENTKNRFKRPN